MKPFIQIGDDVTLKCRSIYFVWELPNLGISLPLIEFGLKWSLKRNAQRESSRIGRGDKDFEHGMPENSH